MKKPWHTPTILWIDDFPGNQYLVTEALTATGCAIDVTHAESGKDAVKLLAHRAFDLVITDLNMPCMNGFEVLKAIRSATANQLRTVPVIVWSSSSRPEDIGTSYSLGANLFLTKPMGFAEFCRQVAAISVLWFGIAGIVDPSACFVSPAPCG